MKIKSLSLIAIASLFLFTSCMFFGKNKVKVSESEVSGLLEGAFEAVTGEYEAQKSEDGDFLLTIKVKRTHQTVPYTEKTLTVLGVDEEDVITYAGFGYEATGQDGDETEVKAAKALYDKKEVFDLLTLAPGEEGELTFRFDKNELPKELKLTSDVQLVSTGELKMEGAVDRYAVKNFTIDANFEKGKIDGKYQYTSSPEGAFLFLVGTVEKDVVKPGLFSYGISIEEQGDMGQHSGNFNGTLVLERNSKSEPYHYVMSGEEVNFRGQMFNFRFESAPIE